MVAEAGALCDVSGDRRKTKVQKKRDNERRGRSGLLDPH